MNWTDLHLLSVGSSGKDCPLSGVGGGRNVMGHINFHSAHRRVTALQGHLLLLPRQEAAWTCLLFAGCLLLITHFSYQASLTVQVLQNKRGAKTTPRKPWFSGRAFIAIPALSAFAASILYGELFSSLRPWISGFLLLTDGGSLADTLSAWIWHRPPAFLSRCCSPEDHGLTTQDSSWQSWQSCSKSGRTWGSQPTVKSEPVLAATLALCPAQSFPFPLSTQSHIFLGKNHSLHRNLMLWKLDNDWGKHFHCLCPSLEPGNLMNFYKWNHGQTFAPQNNALKILSQHK